MEDDKLKNLFADYSPELSSDFQFIKKLEQNIEAVEIVKQHTSRVRSRNIKAVAIAAFVGFIVGFLFSLSLPYLANAVSDWQLTLPKGSMMNTFADNFMIISWAVIGGTSVLAALNTYEISLSCLGHNSRVNQKNLERVP